MFNLEDITKRRDILRERWKVEIHNRPILEVQGKALSNAIAKFAEKQVDAFDYLQEQLKTDEEL